MAIKSTDSATRKAVVDYYDGSWFDYRVIWLDRGNLAKHFGYWEPDTRNHSQSLTNMNRQVAARVNPKPGERVLDAGCGIGGSSMWLARTFGVNTVGISLSANELERARRYAKAKGLEDQCTFQQEDFIATSFPDESFDIVWAQESVCHTIHKDAFCAEAYRLLKPGGRMVMEDWFRPRRPYDAKDEKLFSDWLRGWAIEDLATREEITGYAADAGFENVVLEDITPYMLRSARHLYMVTAALYPGAVLLRALKLRTKVLHENMISARLQWRAHVRNLWFAGILSAQKPVDASTSKPTTKAKSGKAKPKSGGSSKAPKDQGNDVAGANAPAAGHANGAESSNGGKGVPAEGASADQESHEPGEQNETKGDDSKS